MIPAKRAAPFLAAALCCLLPSSVLNGCEGGTSTTAENPAILIGFRMQGKAVEFEGQAMVYASGANPSFFAPAPTDIVDNRVEINMPGLGMGWNNTFGIYPRKGVQKVDGDLLEETSDTRMLLPLTPPGAVGDRLPVIAVEGRQVLQLQKPFSVVVQGDSMTAFAQGITLDTAERRYRDANGKLFDTLWMDLDRPVSATGILDTAGMKQAPLVLFMPGLPYAVRLHGNRFHLPDFPRAKLAMRVLDAAGQVLSLKDTLDLTRVKESGTSLDTLPTLAPGPKVDDIALPAPYPTLMAPKASPEGPLHYTDSVSVTLTAEVGAQIHYTTNGDMPGLYSTRYTGPITLRASHTLKAIAYRKGAYSSSISMNTYVLVPPSPKVSPASQAFRDSLVITLTTAAKDGSVLYTMDGSAPTVSSARYTGPITLKATTDIKAVTSVAGMVLSDIAESHFILVVDTLPNDSLP